MIRRSSSIAFACATLAGCGARASLDLDAFSPVGSGGSGVVSASGGTTGSAGTGAGGAGAGGGIVSGGTGGATVLGDDPCPSGVVGPKPMFGNCSTRDGRSRVEAPHAPHVAWTKKLPTGSGKELATMRLATDGDAHAVLVTTENFADAGAVRRVRSVDGTIDWEEAIAPDEATDTPVLLANGPIDVFAYESGSKEALLQFDPKTGSYDTTTFGFDLYYGPPNPAVTADGSLVFAHSTGVGTGDQKTFVSRVKPNGQVAWTTPSLASLGPPPNPGGSLSPSTIALGKDDLVVVAAGVLTAEGELSVVLAFDGATGVLRWSTTIPRQLVGGPAVQRDGAIVFLSGAPATDLVVLDPKSGGATNAHLGFGAFELFALGKDGVAIVGTDAGQGIDGLAAIDPSGNTLWKKPGEARAATIASDGTIVAFGATITALDPTTGATRWELAAPSPASCIGDIALGSDGRIVGIQCDGTLFGASD